MMKNKIIKEINCPNCHKVVKTYEDYPSWCSSCEWGLVFENKVLPKNKLEEILEKISYKYGNSLFESIKNQDLNISVNSKTKSGRLAFFISYLVISFNIFILLTGIYLLIFIPYYFIKFLGLLCIGLFYISKPKLLKIDKSKFVSKKDFSELYKAVNLVCKKFNTSEVEGIIIDEEFNASITEYGLKKKKVLFIGLPLWSVLNDEEKLDLIGHEIAHCVNGDPSRNKIISTGINTLIKFGNSIHPESLLGNYFIPYYGGFRSFTLELSKYAILPINILLVGISNLLWNLSYILNNLVWIDSQKAEYLADILASSICGNKASISGMKKCSYSDIFYFELQNLVLKGKKTMNNVDIFEEVNNKIKTLPDHEIDRLNRLLTKEEHKIDIKHPPTYSRILLLEEKGYKDGTDIKDKIDFAKIENELNPYKQKIQYKLIDVYRDSMYY